MDGNVEKSDKILINASADEFNKESQYQAGFQNPFCEIKIPSAVPVKQVWAVGGGKGGVGKSLISSSLAIALSRISSKVIAVDLDLGGANLHTTLGMNLPNKTLGDFFERRTANLMDCVVQTDIPNLSVISGAQDKTGIQDLNFERKVRFMEQLRMLDAEYVIVDLGAGTGLHTVDFFLYSDVGVMVALPEPTSIENAYRFIKASYFRKMGVSKSLQPIKHLIEAAMDPNNNHGIKSPSDLFREANKLYPEIGMRLKREIEKFQPKLIVNQTRTQVDVDIGFSMKSVCKRYFGIEMEFIGYLDYDSAVWQSIRRKKPMMLEFPNSKLVSNIERITHYLVKRYSEVKTDIYL